jgi:uncharacterized membrane protein
MIKTPPGWGAHVIAQAYRSIATPTDATWAADQARSLPAVRRLNTADLQWALAQGWEDFKASRTDVLFLCLIYPLVGLILARLASGSDFLPLLFPLASGFALVGPLAAVGLNDLSRRREKGLPAGFLNAFGVFTSPSLLSIVMLGFTLLMMMVAWLTLAQVLYFVTLGREPPISAAAFAHDVIHTHAGQFMAIFGIAIGFVFAAIALVISVVSFPMLLDRPVSVETAVRTSFKVVRRNPRIIALWGLIIAAGLVLGSIPLLLGLVVVMPVLGHATWHLYRRAVRE